MICMKNLRFSGRQRAKVGHQGPPGSARAQPWTRKSLLFHKNYMLGTVDFTSS